MNEKQKALIDGLAADLAPLVRDIEAGPEVTQHHYGRYGSILSQFSKGNKVVAKVIAVALMQAGANRLGVENGLNLFT